MPKLKKAFTLLEILVVVFIIGIIYGLLFVPLTSSMKPKTKEQNNLLSITKRYGEAKALLTNVEEPLYLKCDAKYLECGFYSINNELIGKTFELSVENPEIAFTLKDGKQNIIWNKNSGALELLFAGGMQEIFIQDGKTYKISPFEQSNFAADNADEALKISRQFLALKNDDIAK